MNTSIDTEYFKPVLINGEPFLLEIEILNILLEKSLKQRSLMGIYSLEVL